jgi:hypothetical protein
MSDANHLAQDLMTALSSNDLARYEAVLGEDVGLRLNRWDGREVYRPRSQRERAGRRPKNEARLHGVIIAARKI